MHFRFIFAFMERLKHILIILFALSATSLSAREVINFNKDWKFCLNLETDSNPADIEFDDSGWRTLDVPHDWAIEGDFDEHNPSGTGGGALPGRFRAHGHGGAARALRRLHHPGAGH